MVAGLLPDQARGRTVINDHVRDGGEITTLLDASAQPLLAAWLAEHRPSAHSDVGDALLRAAKETCDEWIAFSPSFAQCGYVALITARRAFALATGMQRVSLCVVDADVPIALAQGCTLQTELGDGWLSFELWSSPAPPDLRVWLGAAYAHARAGIGPRH